MWVPSIWTILMYRSTPSTSQLIVFIYRYLHSISIPDKFWVTVSDDYAPTFGMHVAAVKPIFMETEWSENLPICLDLGVLLADTKVRDVLL